MGFRRAKFTQGNTNCQKNIFENDQDPGHHPRALKVVRDSFGSNRMCQFFCQNLMFMAQAFRKRNNIRGSPCSIFQKMGPNIAIFELVKYGVNGKTVTCLLLGSDFDNF